MGDNKGVREGLPPVSSGRRMRSVRQRAVEVQPDRMNRRAEASQDARGEAERQHEREDRTVHGDVQDTGGPGAGILVQGQRRSSQRPPEQCADRRHHQRLDDELPCDAPVARAECQPDRDLVRSGRGPFHDQVREVRADDEQDKRCGGPHCFVKSLRVRADEPVVKRLYDRCHAAVCPRMFIRERTSDRVHFIARALNGHAVLQPGVCELGIPREPLECCRRRHQRRPQLLRAREREASRHHTDDAGRPPVDSDGSADHVGVRPERAFPELVR